MKNKAGTLLLSRGVAGFVLVLLLMAGFANVSFAEGRIPVKQKAPQKAAAIGDPTDFISITGDLTTISKEALVQTLVGDGMAVSNVKATNCHPTAAGLFSITGDVGIGLKSGIVLGSGAIVNVVGPNTSGGMSTAFGLPGDPDLNAILATGTGSKTSNDACVVEFDFVPQTSLVSFNYVFGSEEYNEFVNTSFNDVFGFFVNGENCATINEDPVSINTINNGRPFGSGGPNSDFYINNATGDYNTQLDGFTTVLACSSLVNPGVTNHIKLAIADAGDSILDSDVFIGAGSFVSVQYGVAVSPSVQYKSGTNTTTQTYVFEVKNMGGASDYFDLTLVGGTWSTFFTGTGSKSMTIGPLAPLEIGWAYVDITIPKTASVNETDTVTLTATSAGSAAADPVSTSATMTTSALGLNCLFNRDLPSLYIPGIPMPVNILAEPSCMKEGDISWALEDNVPPGWLVTNISDGGGFSEGKVSFNNLPAKQMTIAYMVKPASSDTGKVAFSGTGSVSGIDTYITGNSESAYNAGDHPADINNNQFIYAGEYTTYWKYWKSGQTWPSGWNPIKPSFVTRAGQIWATYTGYHFNAAAGSCPACWEVNPTGSASAMAADLAVSAVRLARTTPPKYVKGVPMNVSLLVTPPAGNKVYLVEERTPAGWVVSNISNNGNFDPINKVIKWGPFKYKITVPSRTLTYTVTPPNDATGEKTFMGLASFDGVDISVNSIVPDILIYKVKFVPGGNGSITGETDQAIIESLSATAVTAVPDTNYAFINWTGTGGFVAKTDNPLTVTNVSKDQTITANFALKAAITTKPHAGPLNYKGDTGRLSFTSPTTDLYQVRTAISADSFIHVDIGSIKFVNGKGSLSYFVADNPTSGTLDGYIRIGTAQFNVKQAPTPCEILSVTVTPETLPNTGGILTMMVDVSPYTCKWKMSSAKVAPCANGVDPAVCLQQMFADPGNLPVPGEILTGDQNFTAIIAPTEFTRTLSGKIEISNPPEGKSSKTFKVKQYK